MIIALDTETSTSNKGHPYDQTNKLVCISWAVDGCGYAARVSPELLVALQKLIDSADLIVGFNLKFDIHWLQSVGLQTDHKRLWDCQLAEFIISRQTVRYPSLEDCAIKYNLGHKIDLIKSEYWDKGINTTEIPWHILKGYAAQDALLTLNLYGAQLPSLTPAQHKLLAVLNEDMKVLQTMEKNGLLYDTALCSSRSEELDAKIKESRDSLNSVYPGIPINWNSGDQLSAFLYGGVVKEETKEHIGFFKMGLRKGEPKYKLVIKEHQLPRLYQPLKNTEMSKEGLYSTSEDTLLKLKGKQGPLKTLLELSKMEKLNGTYYKGLPKLNKKMNWKDGYLHGNFNACVAQTGRLSSTQPNLQNFASELQDVFISRYNHEMAIR